MVQTNHYQVGVQVLTDIDVLSDLSNKTLCLFLFPYLFIYGGKKKVTEASWLYLHPVERIVTGHTVSK